MQALPDVLARDQRLRQEIEHYSIAALPAVAGSRVAGRITDTPLYSFPNVPFNHIQLRNSSASSTTSTLAAPQYCAICARSIQRLQGHRFLRCNSSVVALFILDTYLVRENRCCKPRELVQQGHRLGPAQGVASSNRWSCSIP